MYAKKEVIKNVSWGIDVLLAPFFTVDKVMRFSATIHVISRLVKSLRFCNAMQAE